MDAKIVIGLAVPVFLAIIGVYVWVSKHIANGKKHVCKDDIERFKGAVVYKDVCASERKRIEDCVEGEIKNVNLRLERIEKMIDREFDELKDLIMNRS